MGKTYFYNQRGRKIEINNPSQVERCIRAGFIKTTPDAPFYNPIYDKGSGVSSQEEINKAIPQQPDFTKPKVKRSYLEVIVL